MFSKYFCILVIFISIALVAFAEPTPAPTGGDNNSTQPVSGGDAPISPEHSNSTEPVHVEEPKSSTSDSPHEDEQKLQFQFQVGDHQVEAQSEFEGSDSTKKKLSFRMETNDNEGFRFGASIYNSIGDAVSAFRFRIRFRSIIEYNETTGVEGFQVGDQVVHTYNTWSWNAVQDLSGVSGTSKHYKVSTQDGVFSIDIFANYAGLLGNVSLSPSDVKVDVAVNITTLKSQGFLADTNNKLAIKGLVQTKEKTKHQSTTHSEDEEHLEVGETSSTTGVVPGSFSWVNYVDCGATRVPVVNDAPQLINESDDDSEQAYAIYWSITDAGVLASNGSCIWDPQMSMTGAVRIASASSVIMSSALLLSLLALLALFF